MCVCVCVCVRKVIDLVEDSPMEAPVSVHPHQAYSVLARACRLLFLPATSRDALEPCVCQSASACTAIDFFLFEKRKKENFYRRGIGRVSQNSATARHARTRARNTRNARTHTRTHAHTHTHTHTSHGEAGKGGRVSLRSAPFASGRAVGTRVV